MFGFNLGQLLSDLITSILQGFTSPIQPLVALIGTTPFPFTISNAVVIGAWETLTAASDAFLVLLVTVGCIQTMYGQSTGTLYPPPTQLIFRAFLTGLLIHLSFLICQDALIFNNALCGLVKANVAAFINQVTGGQGLNIGQQSIVAAILGSLFLFTLVRIIFQAVKRIVLFNVLLVLSGPAFLLSFHPQTAAWFSFWLRTFTVICFQQFFQFLTFALGFQFLLATKQGGLTGFLLAIAMLNMVAEIPGLLSRFSATAGANASGIGAVIRTAISTAALLA